jgi:hypothetical protein
MVVAEQPLPAGNPNHLRLIIRSTSPRGPLLTGDLNDAYPDTPNIAPEDISFLHRLETRYRLWWQEP